MFQAFGADRGALITQTCWRLNSGPKGLCDFSIGEKICLPGGSGEKKRIFARETVGQIPEVRKPHQE